ncbi:ATP-dependent DNA helicase RecG [Pelistega europaea]|uniref:ATP-dependent DNA helicase RecG n=1 Tax=Pelistega europaea TaxID=106147 RepID=A0A7Y4LAT6_9BURK|nr:ATP-dependent DNA helicase RecG [Pelistega europaea]NOL49101.1 ATP-dependent DNA helicase RecG [Pelistega europaea]
MSSSRLSSPKLTASQQKMQALGLLTDFDLALHLPLRYEDETQIQTIDSIYPGQQVQLEGVVENVAIQMAHRRQLTATFRDATGKLALRWIHFYGSQKTQLEKAGLIRIRGEVRGSSLWGYEIIHPKISKAGTSLPTTLTPIYPSTEGLTQPVLRKAIQSALTRVKLFDSVPEALQQKYGLPSFSQSIHTLHNPSAEEDTQSLMDKTHPAWERVKFDELLAQQIALQLAREERAKLRAPHIKTDDCSLFEQVGQACGFALTTAQQRVLIEIKQDLQRPFPMHRLLQGDVGSGKTIVAALAATWVLQNGYQVAVMAPTEILAEQHYLKMQKWFAGTGIEVAWLSGSLKVKEKRETQEKIQSGHAHLVVGTQALIQKGVEFAHLGLMIVDEQHRFGVEQRLSLSKKGEDQLEDIIPHQLSMSATPIPRTLAMSYLADLDVSVIDELPPGRQAVLTKLMKTERRDELLSRLALECEVGKQAYWVCPLVEESEALQLQTAVDTHQYIQQYLPQCRVGLLHGRMHADEKAQVMQLFASHQLDILVATTVIEVGVDVPNASIMVIEHAERFGLAQLHQLRGRVGRGSTASVCFLLYQEPLSQTAKLRLKALHETNDGFVIAQRDLEQRGPGEFLGLRQSGEQMLRFADIALDQTVLEHAREAAEIMLRDYPQAAHEHVRRWMKGRENYLRS